MIHPLTEHGLHLYDRVRDLERLCARQRATIRRQAALLKVTRAGKRAANSEIRRLEARIRQLEERLGRNSGNSSQPPSADGPEVSRPKRRGKNRGRRGGRSGHPGRSRPLIPVEEVDHVVDCKTDCCCACDHPLAGEDPQPWRHQVSDIPKPRIEVTEYRQHRLSCLNCGRVTTGGPQPTHRELHELLHLAYYAGRPAVRFKILETAIVHGQ